MSNQSHPSPGAIQRLSFYTACPVDTCDRCGQGIKHVAIVWLRDGSFYRYGLDCINKVLEGDNSLKSLFNKNRKLLKRWQDSLAVLERPEDQWPRGSEYYGSGFYFVAGDDGEDLRGDGGGCSIFHPLSDFDKNVAGTRYPLNGEPVRTVEVEPGRNIFWQPNTKENYQIDCRTKAIRAKAFYRKEIDRISGFLGRVLAKGLVTQKEVAS